MDIIRIIFAILLPPVGVFMQVGFGGAFWLNILLTLLGYIPGRRGMSAMASEAPVSAPCRAYLAPP